MNILKIKELSELLQISTNTIYRLCNQGMPHLRIGSQYRFELEKVIKYLQENENEKDYKKS